MAQPPSYSVAPSDASRARILSWGGLLGIVALAIGALVLVFPKKDLLTLLRGESATKNSELTIAYLRNIIRTEPRDIGLRLLLVEKLMAAGDLDGARLTLGDARAVASLSPANQQAWDRWDLAWWQARLRQAKILGQEDHRREAATELLARLKRSIGGLSTPAQVFATLLAAGDLRAAIGASAEAQANDALLLQDQLLARLVALPGASVADLSRGASLALGQGRFQQSSDLYFAARRKAVVPDERFKLLQQGVQSLLASGQPRAAWQAAVRESQPLEPADPAWWWLAELALAAAEPREAALALRHVVAVNASAAALAKTLSPARLQLAWDTFAAAGDLPAALKVAEAALAVQPQNALWLQRKAQAAEWSGLAPRALAAWLELLKQGASERALANVFRLSPMVYDDNALLAAWLALSRQRRLSAEEVAKVVEVYERLGSVDAALAFVRQLRAGASTAAFKGGGAGSADITAQLIGMEAKLLERAGRPVEAIALLEQLRPGGLARDDAMQLASLHLRQGNLPLALRALQAVRLAAGGTVASTGAVFDEAYWELVADLAYETGQRSVAQDALDRLMASGKPQSYQAERAIRLRLDANQIPQALLTAAQLYPRFPDDKILYAWLDAVEAQKSPTGLRALLAALLPQHRQKLEASPDFLARRASLFVRLGDVALARGDYQQALALRPEHAPTRVSYWWLLVDLQDKTALRGELARRGRAARGDVANKEIYGEVLAAAWQLLDEPQLALAALQPAARRRVNDFLWLMNYADVLDRTQRQSQALRVRRHAWLVVQRAAARPADAEQARQALMVQLRLAADFAGGDKKARLWRDLGLLVSQSKGAAQDPAQDAAQHVAQQRQAQELVGAWLLSEGQFDAARRWLWQLHAARMAAPAYQELAVALSQNDLQTLVSLLDRADGGVTGPLKASESGSANGPPSDTASQRLSAQDRLAALRQLRLRGEAATLGFELAQRRPEGDSDEAQQALQDDLLANASRVSVQERTRNAGVLTRQEIRANAAIVASPQLKFTLDMSIARDRSNNTAQIAATPGHDRELRAGLEARTAWGEFKVQWGVRDALARVPSLLLQFTTRLGSHSALQLEAAKGDRSEESSAMSVAGNRDRAAASLNLRGGERLDGQASLATSRFHTQTGAALGSSVDAALTGNWTLRRDYPDVRLQGQLRRSVVRADGQPDAATALLQPGGSTPDVGLFLGPSSTAASISLGVGLAQADPAIYSRAWRPWGEIGFETRQTQGVRQTQGLLRFGAKGSVAGRDQLSVNLDVRPGSGGLSGAQGTRELRLQYEIFYDR